ncbi:ROK family protein [Lactiplantibacillus pentosus]|uniref:ROK family protein n=1 Tax=Lactiplantibacillus pentosus TaxID=1589 RepID=A0AB37RKI6_LACPE|nr:ROK family protein [Lactiplantibacillus pentosus]RMW46660.1 ROK family protein [Lactiplantibacillus pentosus]RMW47590.1 ROK family protein [Lactiplantibacillus pentosus]RMW56293.1 ROK family protein [Lactiplantibacillus pentosus]RMW56317.1 ROK family protein [Lactiplantibacillus pentosus]
MSQYLSFDIGGTNLKYALINHSGNIIEKNHIPTITTSLEEFIESIYQIADHFKGKFDGIAISSPGKIDVKKKIIHYGGALPFLDGLNLGNTLGDRYNVPICVENDGKAAALAEQWLGELKGINTGVALVLGTGVGGGIVIDNHLIYGKDFQAGEFSFIINNFFGKVNDPNTLVGYTCSAVNMIQNINTQLGNTDLKDGLSAFKAIYDKNKEATDIFNEFCRQIAILILNIQSIINSQKIVIGGGISAQPILTTNIKKQLMNLLSESPLLKQQINPPEIVAARFKNDSNLYGALYSLLLQLDK